MDLLLHFELSVLWTVSASSRTVIGGKGEIGICIVVDPADRPCSNFSSLVSSKVVFSHVSIGSRESEWLNALVDHAVAFALPEPSQHSASGGRAAGCPLIWRRSAPRLKISRAGGMPACAYCRHGPVKCPLSLAMSPDRPSGQAQSFRLYIVPCGAFKSKPTTVLSSFGNA